MAEYSLVEVARLIDEGKVGVHYKRATMAVIDVYRTTRTPKSYEEAENFIKCGVKLLAAEDFFESQMQNEVIVDKYAMIYDGKPWFIKFYVMNDFLEQVSFHPPEQDIVTAKGKIPMGGCK